MKNRYMRGGIAAAGATARAGARAGRILWLEAIGVISAIFSISLGAELWREYQHRAGVEHANLRIAGCGFVLAIFCWVAVSSFWRARKLKHSQHHG